MSVLRGSASGTSRRYVLEQAEAIAGVYFGTPCVEVRLRDERVDGLEELRGGHGNTIKDQVTFAAEYEAQESHVVDVPAYGFPKCRRCGRQEGVGSNLPRAVWPDA